MGKTKRFLLSAGLGAAVALAAAATSPRLQYFLNPTENSSPTSSQHQPPMTQREAIDTLREYADSAQNFMNEASQPIRNYSARALSFISSLTEMVRHPDYRTTDFSGDSDQILLARMLFGETRGQTKYEKIAVAHTALNRTKDGQERNGNTLREVILMPKQYSCFNPGTNSRRQVMDPQSVDARSFYDCLKVAGEVLDGKYADPTKGATLYYNPHTMGFPSWNKDHLVKVGHLKISNRKLTQHKFYKEK